MYGNRILSAILLLLLCEVGCAGNEGKDFLGKIAGFWTSGRRVVPYSQGYRFYKDGTFYFYRDFRGKKLSSARYCGSVGKWEVKDNVLRVARKYDLIWKTAWVKDEESLYGMSPGKGNKLEIIESKINGWETIGDVRLYAEGVYVNDDIFTFSYIRLLTLHEEYWNKFEFFIYGLDHWKMCPSVTGGDCEERENDLLANDVVKKAVMKTRSELGL